ncbi:hypothetical protein HDU87_005187 [Geranomyces variabilis]|uniref:Uncharacterized protein n=1 Tax=Geranomyces variabilis TaxID=109894 RepID=A0AAD5TIH3_9FUNG|nr:hypothetical protein HDU87_005187 [Geranomyces variabilis]
MLSHTNPPWSARRKSTFRPPVLRVPSPPADAQTPQSPPPPPPQPALPTSQTSRNASLELITEQLGWAPVSYIDDIINALNDLAYKGISSFEQWLRAYGLEEEETEKGLAATETLFENSIDKYFDKFELLVLQSIFVVPTNLPIRLPHHEELDFSVSAVDEAQADEEIAGLRKAIASAQYLARKLQNEETATQKRIAALQQMKNDIESLASLSRTLPAQPLSLTIPTLLETVTQTRQLAADVHARSHNVSFQELIMRHEDENEDLRDAIAAAIDRRRRQQKQDEKNARSASATPSSRNQQQQQQQQRRRRSSLGVQVRSGREGLECAMEYRDKITGIGAAEDIRAWRQFLGTESVDS